MSTTSTKPRKRSPAKKASRSARLETRISALQKTRIERAAEYEGQSITEFIVRAASTAAEAVIQKHERIRLDEAESRKFVQALLKPPAPNAALRRAFQRHRQSIESR